MDGEKVIIVTQYIRQNRITGVKLLFLWRSLGQSLALLLPLDALLVFFHHLEEIALSNTPFYGKSFFEIELVLSSSFTGEVRKGILSICVCRPGLEALPSLDL